MSTPLSILLTAAYPIDAVERAGGTLALHVKRGDQVSVAILSKSEGGAGVPPTETPEQRQERQARVRDSLGMLGVENVFFLEVDDYALQLRQDLVLQMAGVMRQTRPDVLITHHPWEGPAYGAGAPSVTSICTIQATSVAGQVDPTSQERPINAPVQVFWFSTLPRRRWTATNDLYFDVYVDITTVAQRKVQALRKIRGPEAEAFAAKYVEAVDGAGGLTSHIGYAEAFMRTFPDLYDALPVPEMKYDKAREGESVMWTKMAHFFAHKAP